MNIIDIYLFDAESGAYIDQSIAQESPEETGDYIMPTDSCKDAPPPYSANQIPQRAGGAGGSWTIVADFRGQAIYDQSTGESRQVTDIGDISGGWALTEPPPTLAQAQASQIAIVDVAYADAVQVTVSFTTAAGVTQMYQADNGGPLSSQDVLLKALTGYSIVGATPTGFYWQAADNTQVPFTLADLSGLYGAMLEQGNMAFNRRTSLKAAIRAAQTVGKVQAIIWN